MKKAIHPSLLIIASILVFILILGSVFFAVYKTFYMKKIVHNDLNDYTQGRYLNFAGGDLISDFIPKYKDLGEYETLSFYYSDGRKKTNFFHIYFISFVLDIQYDQETYLKKKSEIEENVVNKYDMKSYNYTGVEIESPQNALYGIYFFEENNIIRYVAMCGKGVDDYVLDLLIPWNTSVEWSFENN